MFHLHSLRAAESTVFYMKLFDILGSGFCSITFDFQSRRQVYPTSFDFLRCSWKPQIATV